MDPLLRKIAYVLASSTRPEGHRSESGSTAVRLPSVQSENSVRKAFTWDVLSSGEGLSGRLCLLSALGFGKWRSICALFQGKETLALVNSKLNEIYERSFPGGQHVGEQFLNNYGGVMRRLAIRELPGKTVQLNAEAAVAEINADLNSPSDRKTIADREKILRLLPDGTDLSKVTEELAWELFGAVRVGSSNALQRDFFRSPKGEITIVGEGEGRRTISFPDRAEEGGEPATDVSKKHAAKEIFQAICDVSGGDLTFIRDTIAMLLEGYLGQDFYSPFLSNCKGHIGQFFLTFLGGLSKENITVSRYSVVVQRREDASPLNVFVGYSVPVINEPTLLSPDSLGISSEVRGLRIGYSARRELDRPEELPTFAADVGGGSVSFSTSET